MRHELLLTWDRHCWTLKNLAKIVNKLVKTEYELVRNLEPLGGSGYTRNPHPLAVSYLWT